MRLNYFSIQRNNFLKLTEGTFKPSDDHLEEIIANPEEVTGFRFAYSTTDEEFKTDYEKMIFVGKVVEFEQVKHLFNSEVPEEYKTCKHAISYDASGNIVDERPILGIDEVVPVSNREELLNAYKAETGYDFVASKLRQ